MHEGQAIQTEMQKRRVHILRRRLNGSCAGFLKAIQTEVRLCEEVVIHGIVRIDLKSQAIFRERFLVLPQCAVDRPKVVVSWHTIPRVGLRPDLIGLSCLFQVAGDKVIIVRLDV